MTKLERTCVKCKNLTFEEELDVMFEGSCYLKKCSLFTRVVDLVDGTVRYESCELARGKESMCGEYGKHFTPRISLLQLIKNEVLKWLE